MATFKQQQITVISWSLPQYLNRLTVCKVTCCMLLVWFKACPSSPIQLWDGKPLIFHISRSYITQPLLPVIYILKNHATVYHGTSCDRARCTPPNKRDINKNKDRVLQLYFLRAYRVPRYKEWFLQALENLSCSHRKGTACVLHAVQIKTKANLQKKKKNAFQILIHISQWPIDKDFNLSTKEWLTLLEILL